MTLRRIFTHRLLVVDVLDVAGDVVRSFACNAGDWVSFMDCQRRAREYLR